MEEKLNSSRYLQFGQHQTKFSFAYLFPLPFPTEISTHTKMVQHNIWDAGQLLPIIHLF